MEQGEAGNVDKGRVRVLRIRETETGAGTVSRVRALSQSFLLLNAFQLCLLDFKLKMCAQILYQRVLCGCVCECT